MIVTLSGRPSSLGFSALYALAASVTHGSIGNAVTTRTSIGSVDCAGAIGLPGDPSERAIRPIATITIATAMTPTKK